MPQHQRRCLVPITGPLARSPARPEGLADHHQPRVDPLHTTLLLAAAITDRNTKLESGLRSRNPQNPDRAKCHDSWVMRRLLTIVTIELSTVLDQMIANGCVYYFEEGGCPSQASKLGVICSGHQGEVRV